MGFIRREIPRQYAAHYTSVLADYLSNTALYLKLYIENSDGYVTNTVKLVHKHRQFFFSFWVLLSLYAIHIE